MHLIHILIVTHVDWYKLVKITIVCISAVAIKLMSHLGVCDGMLL